LHFVVEAILGEPTSGKWLSGAAPAVGGSGRWLGLQLSLL